MKRENLIIYGPLMALVIIGFLVALRYVKPAPPDRITIAAGEKGGAYYAFAERYRVLLAREGLKLVVLETHGAVENLQLLRMGKVDVAFLQGGVGIQGGETAGLEGLGSLYFEPLWLFRRDGLELPGRLPALHGLEVSLGPDGSGTQALVRKLLQDNGFPLDAPGLLALSSKEAAKRLRGFNSLV